MTNFDTPTILAVATNDEIGAFIKNFKGAAKIAAMETDADGKKITHTFELSLADFPIIALEKFLTYGMQRVFNDATGGKDKFESTKSKFEYVDAMIADFELGIVTKARSASVVVTSAGKLARVAARSAIKAQYAKEKRDYKEFSSRTVTEQHEALDAIIAANPIFLEQAQAEIDARNAVSIDLSDM